MAKKKRKPSRAKIDEILIQALVDLIVGTLLILIGKAVRGRDNFPLCPQYKYTEFLFHCQCEMKSFLLSLGAMMICFGIVKLIYYAIIKAKED